MTLVQVAEDTTMPVPGFEHQTWQCSGVGPRTADDIHSRQNISSGSDDEAGPNSRNRPGGADPISVVATDQRLPAESQSVSVEPTQAVPAEPALPTPAGVKCQTNARLEKLRKVQERAAVAKETASEIERRAEFNRFWDSLLLVPS